MSNAGPSVVRGGALLAAGLAVSNAFGYGLNLVASRVLGPGEFGAFAALMGIVLVANVGALALQSVTARRLATDGPAAAPALVLLGRLTGFGIGAALALTAPAFSLFLHVDTAQVLLVAASMVPMTLVGARLGLAQGEERFGPLAGLYVLVAAGKMGGALVGLAIRDSVTAALIGMLVGAVATAAMAATLIPAPVATSATVEPGAAAELLIAAGALFAFFGLTNVDVLLARHHLDPTEAGLYALGAVVAKGAFWFPQFIAVLAYPMLVDSARRDRAIRLSLALVAASGALLTAGTALLPDLAVDIVGGNDYAELADNVALFALEGSLFAIAQLLIYARLAQGDRRAGVGVAAVGVGLVLAVQLLFNDSVTAIVLSVCVAAATLCLAGAAAELRGPPTNSDAASGELPGGEADQDGATGGDLDGLGTVEAQEVPETSEDPERQQPTR